MSSQPTINDVRQAVYDHGPTLPHEAAGIAGCDRVLARRCLDELVSRGELEVVAGRYRCPRCHGAARVPASSCGLPPGADVPCPGCRPVAHERAAGIVRAIARFEHREQKARRA